VWWAYIFGVEGVASAPDERSRVADARDVLAAAQDERVRDLIDLRRIEKRSWRAMTSAPRDAQLCRDHGVVTVGTP
jgi:hypothetical protein